MAQTCESKEVQQLLGFRNVYRIFVQAYATIVSPISDLLTGNRQDFTFAEAQEAGFLKIVISYTSGKTAILRQFDQDRPALIDTDASDFTWGAVLSQ